MKKEAIIFDMDGVLVNTEPHHKVIEHRMFLELGIDISEEDRDPYIGMAADELWAAVVEKFNLIHSPDDLFDLNNQRVIEYFGKSEDMQPIPGVREILDWIEKHHVPLAVASSSSDIVIDALLKESGLDSYFAIRVGGQSVKKSKPAPYIYHRTADLLHVQAEKCLVIEDSTNGITAAKSSGMYCIGYQGTGYSGQDQSKADEIIHHFDELIPILEREFETNSDRIR